jgi:exosome complex RNA-binding protein Csl4
VAHPQPYTDRQIAAGMGFPDMNCVRPRITSCRQQLVRAVDSVRCPRDGKTVRRVTPVKRQADLPFNYS